jgi:hypothetical protein
MKVGSAAGASSGASPMPAAWREPAILAAAILLPGCWSDAAAQLTHDLESGAARMGSSDGSPCSPVHRAPSAPGECEGPCRVQFDRVGAIIVWCKDANVAATVSSHSTMSHGHFVDNPETFILDQPAREPLVIELERRGGRVLISSVR